MAASDVIQPATYASGESRWIAHHSVLNSQLPASTRRGWSRQSPWNTLPMRNTIAALRDYFPAAKFGQPAGKDAIEKVCRQFPAAPEELREFWSICDGIDLGLEDEVVGILYSIDQVEKRLEWWLGDNDDLHSQLIPIADDCCGDFDCVHCGDAALNGCVICIEQHWTPAGLLAGSFDKYLEFWAGKKMAEFSPSGQSDPRYRPAELPGWPWVGKPELQHPWPHNEEWLRANDAVAERLLSDAKLRSFFEE